MRVVLPKTTDEAMPAWRDLLRWPLLGPVLRWRWGRAGFQVGLLLVALLMVYDGFTGPREPHRNLATVLAWVHYRGLLLLALLSLGNVFCMACPFSLLRTVGRRLSVAGWRWPRPLRTKGVAVAFLFLIFFLYEWLDLWAWPWGTAWVILAYFAAAFVLEALFQESAFCKYVCPLGHFNYVHAALAGVQVQARNSEVCRTCPGKECVRGTERVPGCGTLLFVPQMRGNFDCTLCLDCARACPYDNVALAVRSPLAEVADPDAWPRRWDVAFLVFFLLAASLVNALGMTPPAYDVLDWLARWGLSHEGGRLLVLFAVLNLGAPLAVMALLVRWHRRFLPHRRANLALSRLAPALVPLSFGIWAAHYGYHFWSTAWVLVPVLQEFARSHGLNWGSPRWEPVFLLPPGWWYPLQVLLVLAGFGLTLWSLTRRAQKAFPHTDRQALLFPWVVLAMLVAWAAIALFALPMEMRGSPLGH